MPAFLDHQLSTTINSMNSGYHLLLILGITLLLISDTSNAQEYAEGSYGKKNIVYNETCIQTLKMMRVRVQPWLKQNASKIGKFKRGRINEDSLKLTFEYLQSDTTSYSPATGITLQFNSSQPYPTKSPAKAHWQFIGITFNSSWKWPGSFPFKLQKELANLINHQLDSINILEIDKATEILNTRNEKGFVLTGTNELELIIDSIWSNDKGYYFASTSEHNKTVKNIALYPPVTEVILDEQPILNHELILTKLTSNKNPFKYILPLDSYFLEHMPIGKLPAGLYSIRAMATHNQNTWVDLAPTLVDGSPIIRTEKRSWMGTVVSKKFMFMIDGNNTITPIN